MLEISNRHFDSTGGRCNLVPLAMRGASRAGYISYMVGNPVVGRPCHAVGGRLSILLLGTLFAPSVSTVFVTLGAAR